MASFVSPLMKRSVHVLWAAALVLVVGGMVAGCGQSSFVGRQFNDFTAYYNTFYNARTAFEKGLESVNNSDVTVERTRYVSIFSTPERQSSGESFEKAIQKSADLLREHPNSKWVDDALIIIGRSYYYQQNYVGAAQKFREVIALDAEREGEARFRLAQTLVAAQRYDDATEALTGALNADENYGTWTARMYLLRGELLVRQEQWESAETALAEGLEGDLPDDAAARGAFLLGQVRETLENYEGARTAYRRVPQYNPRYAIEFAARLNAIEMEGVHGSPEKALDQLGELRRGDDTQAMRSEMTVVRARLYEAQGRPDNARDALLERLREGRDGGAQGRSRSTAGWGLLHYELGTLYRDAYENYTRAAAHFDTAATALSSGSRPQGEGAEDQVQALPRAPSNVDVQSERYGGLAERAQSVARMDSLLRLGRMEESEFQSFVRTVREKRLKQREAEAQKQREQQFRAQGTTNRDRSDDSGSLASATNSSDAGFLFHRDPTQVQKGRQQFREKWGDRPLVDNWRRKRAIQGGTASADSVSNLERTEGAGGTSSQSATRSLVDVSAVPRDSASQAEMEKERAFARYELANSLFRAANRPDSAETWYRRVIEENEDQEVARQALYALAQSQMAQGDTTAARETYRRVIREYPETKFAERSRQQLGIEQAGQGANLEASRADSAYARAYKSWQTRASAPVLDSLFSVAEEYPETEAAPKALLAAGVLYHRLVKEDTSQTYPDSTESVGERMNRNLHALISADSTSADTTRAVADTVVADSTRPDTTRLDTLETGPSRVDSTSKSQRAAVRLDSVETDSTIQGSERADSIRSAVSSDSATTTTPVDSVSQRTDTTDTTATAPVSPTEAVLDTAAVRDTTAVVADSLAGDSLAVDDTLRSVQSDSTRSEQEKTFNPLDPLKRLLTYLTEEYDGSPQSTRAQTLLDGFKRRAQPDSATQAMTMDSVVVVDSTDWRLGLDSLNVGDSLAADSVSADTSKPNDIPIDTTSADPASVDTTTGSQRLPMDTLRSDEPAPETPRDSTVSPVPDTTAPSEPDSTGGVPEDSTGKRRMPRGKTFDDVKTGPAPRPIVAVPVRKRWSVIRGSGLSDGLWSTSRKS